MGKIGMQAETKTRVAIVIPSFRIGGAQRMVYELIRHINLDAYDVTVVCYFGWDCDAHLLALVRDAGVKVCLLEHTEFNLKTVVGVKKALDAVSPQIVHAHLGGIQASSLWLLMNNVPLVATLHTVMPNALSKMAVKLVRYLKRLGRVALVAVSERNLKTITDYDGAWGSISRCINNGVTLSDYKCCQYGGASRFINVATLDDNKNQSLIIDAFRRHRKKHPDSTLTLVGGGPCLGSLIDRAKDMSNCVRFLGPINTVPAELENANVYIQSSKREGLPLCIIEAMASGLPIIATEVGGVPDIVSDGKNGILIPSESIDGMESAMDRLSEVELRSSFGSESISRVNDFSSERMAREYENLFMEMIR